ncbi:hypothetical protein A3F58_03280 [Candidatus Roizmanbacteria bacterium RIFCSPHIGHO2_12_FULL_37_9b]|uniref:Uncharacterized protein n=1 Tax=Candidatus Roizmanbacteria bacterium RIFCSPHIGHO2_02_FULL_38_11 TaxID=1802039 RepID=A0A1F7GZW6_9BACT|nr:MAG: hypothetical protein A3C25_04560 [Candidatus Roizmanbacteria bacterium RIFCSPHIGHO2_02_FULL_38_11]OGK33332.1 MAG: hypothetical protein A3F58_03280 [Candidatus Roizmanbacteria bacterium RIFCSPHIGHO2_12_FULL_37_9b]
MGVSLQEVDQRQINRPSQPIQFYLSSLINCSAFFPSSRRESQKKTFYKTTLWTGPGQTCDGTTTDSD